MATGAGTRAGRSVITTVVVTVRVDGFVNAEQGAQAGGMAPVKWKRVGKLPSALKLNAKTGLLSGIAKKRPGRSRSRSRRSTRRRQRTSPR